MKVKYLLSALVVLLLIEILFGGIQAFAQFKEYKDQFGRFSIQIPQSWNLASPSIYKTFDSIRIDSHNADNMVFVMTAVDLYGKLSEDEFEKSTREANADTIRQSPGAILIQDTDCTKYVIDGQKACSMIYTEPSPRGQYTEKQLVIIFDTEKQGISILFSGPNDKFDKYIPTMETILNSIKAP